MGQTKRYPGVRPFETEDKDLFFGRTRDIADLSDLIALERLLVLFGKSGYGKSSLINAGIIPQLNADAEDDAAALMPIVVRLGSYVEGTSASPIESILSRLDEKAKYTEGSQFLDGLMSERALWYQFKRRQTGDKHRFLLIFDQFEEFFTYPLAQQTAFKTQLAELLYQDTPQNVREAAPTLSKDQRRLLAQTLEVKVLFAIRADRMSLLDSMKDKLPAILQKRYELKGLSEEQAKEAIEKPAKIILPPSGGGGAFVTPPFDYTAAALNTIIEELSDNRTKSIESFLVQIACAEIEKSVEKGGIADLDGNGLPDVDILNLPNFDNLYENYYRGKINELPQSLQLAAQTLIEDKLIFEDTQTGEARRLSVDSGVLLTEKGITPTLLNQLESTFLLRRESTSTGGFNYEVSHDTMIAPILKSKAERKAVEKAAEERLEAKKRQRRLLAILAAAVVSLAVVIGVVVYVLKLRNDAVDALKVAEKEKVKAEKSLNDFLEAQKANEMLEFKTTLQNVRANLKGGNCPEKATIERIKFVKAKYQTDVELQKEINQILSQLSNCQ